MARKRRVEAAGAETDEVKRIFEHIDPERIRTVSVLLMAFGVVVLFLRITRQAMVPFVIAVFLNYAFSPVSAWFERSIKGPRFVASVLTILTAVLLALGLAAVMFLSFSGFVRSLEQYKEKMLESLVALAGWVNRSGAAFGVRIDEALLTDPFKALPMREWARDVSTGLLGFFAQAALVLVFFIFLVGYRVKRPAGPPKKPGIGRIIHEKVSRYLAVKFVVSLATGIVTWIVLSLIGVELALMFGLFAFLLNFIPNFGSVVAVLLPLPVALIQFGVNWRVLLTLVVPTMCQFTIGNLIEPRIMGESLGLHPVVVLLALLLWGSLWGVPGMILAVPITAVLKIVLDRYEITHGFARALAGEIDH